MHLPGFSYQILKDARQCENKHKFCYSCIFVWSTSGNPTNHSRCPVCRVEGLYVRNPEVEERVNGLRVKCHLKTCRWKGVLKDYAEHQHNTYGTYLQADDVTSTSAVSLPHVTARTETRLRPAPSRPLLPTNNSAPGHVESQTSVSSDVSDTNTQTSTSSSSSVNTVARATTPRRQPLNNVTNNNQSTRPNASNQRSNRTSSSNPPSQRSQPSTGNATARSRARSRPRNASPQRRTNTTATGLPVNGRLTSRARIRNGGIQNNETNPTAQNASRPNQEAAPANTVVQTTNEEILTPRPPTTPRPTVNLNASSRRQPTLPSLVDTEHFTVVTVRPGLDSLDSNNNVSQPDNTSERAALDLDRRQYVPDYVRRANQSRSFGSIRDRLNESRQRLDMLMGAFSSEIDRGRHDLSVFQQEREQRRQEQMNEVRDLGRRLTHVASELRGLLSQRRQIRHQIDTLTDAASEDTD